MKKNTKTYKVVIEDYPEVYNHEKKRFEKSKSRAIQALRRASAEIGRPLSFRDAKKIISEKVPGVMFNKLTKSELDFVQWALRMYECPYKVQEEGTPPGSWLTPEDFIWPR